MSWLQRKPGFPSHTRQEGWSGASRRRTRRVQQASLYNWTASWRTGCALVMLWCCLSVIPAGAQQQQQPEDPEDEKQIGLWLDQGISAGLSSNKVFGIRITSAVRRQGFKPIEVFHA